MYCRFKRLLDVSFASLALLITLPLFVAVAAAIRVTMGRPLFFRQIRPGFNERLFTLIKFRTMNTACNREGVLLSDSERLTVLGRLLRRSYLQHLPQLWNVLRGELSLVGPRPLFVRYLADYTQEERRRHSVRPGLTGWAEVHGAKGMPMAERVAMDLWYVDHLSFWLDVRIILRTIWKLLSRQYVAPDATGERELNQLNLDTSEP